MPKDQKTIHDKGFSMYYRPEVDPYSLTPEQQLDFAKIKVGPKTLEDATLELGSIKKQNQRFGNKQYILKTIADKDYRTLREISNYFYEISGIYERACKYFAFLYRYDWYIVPYIDDDTVGEEKILSEMSKLLRYLDNSNIKKLCGDIALKVIVDGCYYGYVVDTAEGLAIQDLPVEYCRSRYKIGNRPAVEFNMAFFDEKFADLSYKLKVLDLFPDEFKKGYLLYKKGKLQGDYPNDKKGWYLLDPKSAFKMNINGTDYPILVNAIPAILDLDAAQELDRKKMMQKLLKVIIQKLPLDKNGELIFDVDEAKDIHNNSVQMLKRAIGVDVMTTFADVTVADLADKNTSTTTDELEKVERALYNGLGVSQNLFNTDGNLSLEKSILNDEASMRNLILQFADWVNFLIVRKFPGKKRYNFRAVFLETTIYNYQDLAKVYKEQVQLGYSKMLPQIALGHSQSAILAMAHFENDIMHLYDVMIPPLMSSTMSSEDVLGTKAAEKGAAPKGAAPAAPSAGGEAKKNGRPEKKDSEKSEKTIQNKESMS